MSARLASVSSSSAHDIGDAASTTSAMITAVMRRMRYLLAAYEQFASETSLGRHAHRNAGRRQHEHRTCGRSLPELLALALATCGAHKDCVGAGGKEVPRSS